jgi:glucose/galactose 1-dehydrogenase (NADP+)/aldose 1-dehydrogenase [NAD(P)+]
MRAIVTFPPTGGVEMSDYRETTTSGIKVRTLRTGICGTDKELVSGQLKFARPESGNALILGHEALGVVEDSGNSEEFVEGDIVVPMVRRPGKCRMCKLGRQDYCEDGDFVEAGIRGKNGFMRDEFYEDPRFLLKVDNKEAMKLAVLTEPMKNVMKIFEIFNFLRYRIPWYCDDSTLSCKNIYVFGTGTEGLLISLVFRTAGFSVTAVNRHPLIESEMRFLESNKIDFLDTSSESIESAVKDRGMNAAIDAVGSMDVIKEITDNISNNGIVIMFGTAGQLPTRTYEIIEGIVDKNISIAGSVDGAKIHYSQAIEFIEDKGVKTNLGSIITGVYKPEEIKIFKEKEEGEIKKVIDWT